jgi:mRNA-decapping enzyme subunit 2
MSFTTSAPASLDDALEDVETRFLYNLPESELNSPERLFYQIEQAYWYYEDFKADKFSHLPHFSTLKAFATKIFSHCELLKNMSNKFSQLFSEFSQYKSKIPVCGCILLNPDMSKMVLVKDWNGNSWTFPRGKINENETELDCAIREVYEETGFNAREHCNANDFVITFQGEKKIQLFIAVDVSENTIFEPQVRKEISEIKFHPISSIPAHTYNVHPFVPKLKRWISQNQRSKGKVKKEKDEKKKKKDVRAAKAEDVPRILKRMKNEFDSRNEDTFQTSNSNKKGWSVADMFSANAKLTGRDYTYDGNPHGFGDAHPRFVKYSSGETMLDKNLDNDYLQFAQQSKNFTVQDGLILDFYALQASLQPQDNLRRSFFKRVVLDTRSIVAAVDVELKKRPLPLS